MTDNSDALQPAEAFSTIIIFAAMADGIVEEAEKDIIVNILSRIKIFKLYQKEIKKLLAQCLHSLMIDSDATLMNAIASLPQELHDTAFAVATDVIMSDGQVTKEEEITLNLLADKLSVEKEIANQIVHVMAIKNKG